MTTDAPAKDASTASLEGVSGRYKWYALSILIVVYIFNFLDRQIFSILQQAIKEDLHLSDTALGFLGGLAFALLYTALGIPVARLADRHARSKIIAVSLAIWSAMTALCGAAQGFVTLALARVGVGIGEAGCSPAAHSMISDYFGPRQRATALALYQSGAQVGVALGFVIGGYVNLYLGWREAFIIVGLPGVLLAAFVWFVLREPVRGQSELKAASAKDAEQPKLKAAIAYMWNNKTFRHTSLGFAVTGFVGYGSSQWVPSFYIRTFGVDTGTLSLYLAMISAFIGAVSTFGGGMLGDYLAKRDVRWLSWIACLSLFGSKIMFAVMLFQPTFHLAIVCYILPTLLNGLYLGPGFATIQGLVPLGMRALAASVVIFMTNLIGLGLGPLAVGFVSDLLIGAGVENSLRWALLLNTAFAIWAIVHFYIASLSIRNDLVTGR